MVLGTSRGGVRSILGAGLGASRGQDHGGCRWKPGARWRRDQDPLTGPPGASWEGRCTRTW